MKKNDYRNLKTKKIEDLKKTVSEKKLELMKLLSNKVAKGDKNLMKGRNLKKEIAQILTLIREMEIMGKETEIKKEETKKQSLK
jgi:ribosomal protein L29